MRHAIIKNIGSVTLALTMLTVFTGCAGNANSGGQNDGSDISESTVSTDSTDSNNSNANVNAKVKIDGSKFTIDGKEFWINGANTPWENWNDFGGNMNEEFWDNTFSQLVSDGINCTRIWINCNGEGVVRLKSDGAIKSINEEHWNDLDKLFSLAEKHRIYLMPTLLSFDHCKGDTPSAEKWRELIKSKENCDEYAEQYVAEFCKRYGENEYLFGIDIMNEPDWVYENAECGKLPWDNLCYLFGKCAEVIHENCSTPVTVGFAMIKYNSAKFEGDKLSDANLQKLTGSDKAYIDFYSTHYYMWEKPYFGFPFDISPKEFGLDTDKPCLIGETSNDDEAEAGMNLTEKYRKSYENGWCGVMVWMQTQDDKSWYRYDLTEVATNAMANLIPEKIDPLGFHNYGVQSVADAA
ncbi:MAG: cellulase (glycosyl hydrolase family 5) [Ruminiclostridium sp.]